MSDNKVLSVYVMFAKALSLSNPFDAKGSFNLLHRMTREMGFFVESHMGIAIETSLAAIEAQDTQRSAIARYALQRVTIELENRLRANTG